MRIKSLYLVALLATIQLPCSVYASPCAARVGQLGLDSPSRGSKSRGLVESVGWGWLGRRYTVRGTIVPENHQPVQEGTFDRFLISHRLPAFGSGLVIAFGSLHWMEPIRGTGPLKLVEDYFGYLPIAYPGIAALTAHALVQWQRMTSRFYFRARTAKGTKAAAQRADLTPRYQAALKELLSARGAALRSFRRGQREYRPYHLVAYTQGSTITLLTLLAAPVKALPEEGPIEIDLAVVLSREEPQSEIRTPTSTPRS